MHIQEISNTPLPDCDRQKQKPNVQKSPAGFLDDMCLGMADSVTERFSPRKSKRRLSGQVIDRILGKILILAHVVSEPTSWLQHDGWAGLH